MCGKGVTSEVCLIEISWCNDGRCEVVHISSMVFFGFQFSGRLWKIGFKCLSRMEVQETSLRNVLKEAKFLPKGWF